MSEGSRFPKLQENSSAPGENVYDATLATVKTRTDRRTDSPSHLQQRLLGRGQQVDGGGQLLEEVGGQIGQADALDPVHEEVQVGPDLNASRPLVEPGHGAWRTTRCRGGENTQRNDRTHKERS